MLSVNMYSDVDHIDSSFGGGFILVIFRLSAKFQ